MAMIIMMMMINNDNDVRTTHSDPVVRFMEVFVERQTFPGNGFLTSKKLSSNLKFDDSFGRSYRQIYVISITLC
jgi:hypothetical protein